MAGMGPLVARASRVLRAGQCAAAAAPARRWRSAPALDAHYDAVICGAGAAGVSTAYHLTVDYGAKVLLVDQRPPFSYTSAYSTECYRNFWGSNVPMTQFMNRSIDLLEMHADNCDNAFSMNRRGYFFLSGTEAGAAKHSQTAALASTAGAGDVRTFSDGAHGHRYDPTADYNADISGIDVFLGADAVQSYLPGFVSDKVTSMIHAKRCGWMNAQQMGMHCLGAARATGLLHTACPYTLTAVRSGEGAADASVSVDIVGETSGETTTVSAGSFINCAGPFALGVNDLMPGVIEYPFEHELHAKVVMNDTMAVVPDGSPMMIWDDEITLPWEDDEKEMLRDMGGFEAKLVDPMPSGVHFRPYDGAVNSLVMLWECVHEDVHVDRVPNPEPEFLDVYPEVVLRGLSEMVPGLQRYVDEGIPANTMTDGGYYSKAPDNIPLIGQSGPGLYTCVGLSGYGIMASCAAGDLAAKHVTGAELPMYANDLRPDRFEDEDYRRLVESGGAQSLQI